MEQLGSLQRNCEHRETLAPHSPWQSDCSWGGTGQGKPMQELGNRKQRRSGAGCGHNARKEAAEVAPCSAPWRAQPCSQSLPSLLWPQLQQPKEGSVHGSGEVEGAVITMGGNPALHPGLPQTADTRNERGSSMSGCCQPAPSFWGSKNCSQNNSSHL